MIKSSLSVDSTIGCESCLAYLERGRMILSKSEISGNEEEPFEKILSFESDKAEEVKPLIIDKKPKLDTDGSYSRTKQLSNEDFWSAIMESEGRDYAFKLLQNNFGTENGLSVKLSSGRVVSRLGEVGPADFGIVSSYWHKFD